MSWIRSAVNKAVVVGGNNNLTRVVRGYADSVASQAGQAVAGGAKLLHDRLATKNLQSYKHAVKILEEVSVSYRGVERVQLLRRWLVSLKEVERLSAVVDEPLSTDKDTDALSILNESKDSPSMPIMVSRA
ncbi:actin binding motor protein [Lithospermum erythrorhizon]|uniref:Actin binding motor protein n=1 Tax=Lithospermum erythrorhizon TaxID=34254 RepID=A0AAV3RBJ2_LITER